MGAENVQGASARDIIHINFKKKLSPVAKKKRFVSKRSYKSGIGQRIALTYAISSSLAPMPFSVSKLEENDPALTVISSLKPILAVTNMFIFIHIDPFQ